MPRALVTGAAGFLGSHLCEHLLEKGWKVVGMDNFITGDRRNLEELNTKSGFSFVNHDVTQFISFPGELDGIFHFASPASPIDYLEIPIQTMKVGALGTHNCLGLALSKGAKFILASTSECYGDPLVHPQPESYFGNVNPVGPRGCYDEAKRFAEALTMSYYRHHGLATRIVRIFNTYGPRMRLDDGRVLPAFISQALRGQPLSVFGEGTQTRSFCYVDDLIDGIYRLFQSDEIEPTNIGNPREMTILEFAQHVQDAVGSAVPIEHHPLPADDPKVRQPDITKAKGLLSWEPQVSLEVGIQKCLDYFRGRVAEETA